MSATRRPFRRMNGASSTTETCSKAGGLLAGGAVAAADPAQRGAALALYALAGFTTGFVGPVAVGNVLDSFGGAASASGWMAGYAVIAIGSAAAACAVWRAPE